MTSERNTPDNQPGIWMPVVLGAPGAWEWNVKRNRGTGWEVIARSDQIYPSHADAKQALQAFMAAEAIWESSEKDDGPSTKPTT